MARTNRANALDNRTARLKLPIQKRFYAGIGGGLALCYRRDGKGIGTWTARIGFHEYKTRLIGEADDFKDADGETVFTYFQAAEKARELEKEYAFLREVIPDAAIVTHPYTDPEAFLP